MQSIRKVAQLYEKLLGEQPVTMGEKYRRADFCCIAVATDGTHVVGNTYTREVFLPTAEELALLQQEEIVASDCSAELIRKWYFVPESYDEIEAIDFLRMLLRQVDAKSDTIRGALLMMTGDCNARCFYCYQKGRFTCRDTMTNETARAVAEYLADHADENRLRLSWHGGEPTLCAEQIGIICARLRERNVPFFSNAFTNGYLLDKAFAARAQAEWNLRGVQLTMDGPEDVYNRCKAYIYKDDPSPYKHILQNIREMLDLGIHVSVRVNVDRHNLAQLKALAEELAGLFAGEEGFSLFCAALFEDCRDLSKGHTDAMREQITDHLIAFYQYCRELGLVIRQDFRPSITLHRCVATNPRQIEILPDGSLSCCDHAIDEDVYGSVFSPERDVALRAAWTASTNNKETCTGCVAYSDCILLERCSPHVRGCNPSSKRLKAFQMREGILEEYRKWRASSEKKLL